MLRNCKILVAKTAGFCFGVDRAVKIVYNELDNRNNVVTLGPIIHNTNVVSDLEQKGCKAVGLDEVTADRTVIIRSHGVSKAVTDRLREIGCEIVDATCPFVKRIHKIAAERSAEGYEILIAGDSSHPEVEGIRGYCTNGSFVFDGCQELENLVKSEGFSEKKLAILAQTTYNKAKWEKCCEAARELVPDALIYNTICSATAERQAEAAALAKESDLMIIVGGRHSSNTLKLQAVCGEFCPCYLIEGADELAGIDLSRARSIGVSAGASTPAYIIKEVLRTMSEIINNEEEFNFEEALEASLKPIHIGKRVQGTVLSVNSNEVYVDLGTKQQGIIPAAELSDDPAAKPEDVVSVGDTVDLIVLKTNDQDGIVTLSKKKVDAALGFEKICKAKDENEILTGTVANVVKGGVLVSSNGVKVFVPASQAAPRRDFDLGELLKKQVEFKILEINEQKQRAVGSIRAVSREKKAAAQAAFFDNIKAGDSVKGEVKSITDYGVFVDLGGVDGLIRRADLSWNRFKHPSEIVSVGDNIEVIVKDIDPETKKVALTYKKDSDNPWELFRSEYEVGQVIKATVVSLTSFGAFAQIINGVDGLIHISQIANKRVDNVADMLKVGDEVEVKITDIDTEKKRISLSIRALLPEEEEESVGEFTGEEAVEEAAEEAEEAVEEAVEEAAEEPAADAADAAAETEDAAE